MKNSLFPLLLALLLCSVSTRLLANEPAAEHPHPVESTTTEVKAEPAHEEHHPPTVEAKVETSADAHPAVEEKAHPVEHVKAPAHVEAPVKKKAPKAKAQVKPKPKRDFVYQEPVKVDQPGERIVDPDPRMETARSTIEDLHTLAPPTHKYVNRKLASGDNAADLQYYKELDRKLGVNLGMMMPFGDFQADFSTAPALGIHYTWEAMAPFSFSLSTLRASCHHKNGPASGKLTVNSIAFGTIGSFPTGRFIPFVKLEGAFNFTDVSFDANRIFVSGNDTFITTVGVNFGIGWDFVVGRELSLGLDATYHYSVPKKALLSNGDQYDLGSSYATATFRVNF